MNASRPAFEGSSESACTHRWVIENPDGETSRGVCKYCGATRHFRNADAWRINPWMGRAPRKSN